MNTNLNEDLEALRISTTTFITQTEEVPENHPYDKVKSNHGYSKIKKKGIGNGFGRWRCLIEIMFFFG